MNVARQAALLAGVPVLRRGHDRQPLLRVGPAGDRPRRPGDRGRRGRRDRRRRDRVHEPDPDGRPQDRPQPDPARAPTPTSTSAWGSRPRTWRESTGSAARTPTASRSSRTARPLAAIDAGRFKDEIVPSHGRASTARRRRASTFDTDEGPRRDTDLAALAKLKPAFAADGSVTAGNASQMSDGAAATVLVVGRQGEGARPAADRAARRLRGGGRASRDHGHRPRGGDPEGPPAGRPRRSTDIDLVELNEAFACQALAVIAASGLDPERVNVNGGAVALGHPLGCTGAKLTTQILHEMARRGSRYGLVTDVRGGRDGRGRDLRTIVKRKGDEHMATEAKVPVVAAKGGSFLIEDRAPDEVFTPEDFSEEQVMIGQTADDFMVKELVPRLPRAPEARLRAEPRAPAQGRGAGPPRGRGPGGVRRAWASTRSRAASSRRRRGATAASPPPSRSRSGSGPSPSSTSAPRRRRRSTCRSSPPASG